MKKIIRDTSVLCNKRNLIIEQDAKDMYYITEDGFPVLGPYYNKVTAESQLSWVRRV